MPLLCAPQISTYFIDCEKSYKMGNDTVNW